MDSELSKKTVSEKIKEANKRSELTDQLFDQNAKPAGGLDLGTPVTTIMEFKVRRVVH